LREYIPREYSQCLRTFAVTDDQQKQSYHMVLKLYYITSFRTDTLTQQGFEQAVSLNILLQKGTMFQRKIYEGGLIFKEIRNVRISLVSNNSSSLPKLEKLELLDLK